MKIFKQFLFAAFFQILFAASLFPQKYDSGTRLLKGVEVLSATPLQLDYVLENLADTAQITVNLHEGKTHLVLNDGSGEWREWWYHMGKWRVKTSDETDPTVPSHVKNITSSDIANWNTAYQWGNHNDVTWGSFTPTISGGGSASYTLNPISFAKYCQNNRVVQLELYFMITGVSGTGTSTEISIALPVYLCPYKTVGLMTNPSICIQKHGKILKQGYTHLGGYLQNVTGDIRLIQSNDMGSEFVKNLEIGSYLQFSITYIL
jgi:hypothetical protein